MSKKIAMLHGRFQPYGNHHIEGLYETLLNGDVDSVIVGITNPTEKTSGFSKGDNHRHLKSANPYSFLERKLMVEASIILDDRLKEKRHQIRVIPFPVNTIIDEINDKQLDEKETIRKIMAKRITEVMEEFSKTYSEADITEIAELIQKDLAQYMVVFDEWDETKKELFDKAQYEVNVLDLKRYLSATQIREQMKQKGEWEKLVPEGTKRVIEAIKAREARANNDNCR